MMLNFSNLVMIVAYQLKADTKRCGRLDVRRWSVSTQERKVTAAVSLVGFQRLRAMGMLSRELCSLRPFGSHTSYFHMLSTKLVAGFGHFYWATAHASQKVSTIKVTQPHSQKILLHSTYASLEYGSHRINWVQTSLAVIYGLLAVIGVLSNVLVAYILLFIRRRTLSNITNIFVLVLALSDILLCGFNMPVQMYYELKESAPLNSAACKIMFSIFGIPMHISCLIILLIACDRYQIIIYPLYPRMSPRMALILVAVVVAISVGNSLPVAVYSTVITVVHHPNISERVSHDHASPSTQRGKLLSTESHIYCVEQWTNTTARLIYSFATFLLHFFVPLALTACLYGHIFCRLHERRFHRGALERKRRTNKILIRIVVCFVICWTPWACFSLWLELHAYFVQTSSVARNMNSLTSSAGMETSLVDILSLSIISKRMARETLWYTATSDSSSTLSSPEMLNVYNAESEVQRGHAPTAPSAREWSKKLSDDFPIFGLSTLENHTRVIDLCLKLFAMGSGCINPWLYGWFNKFFLSILKMFWKRAIHKTDWIMKIKEVIGRARYVRWRLVPQQSVPIYEKRSTDFDSNIHSGNGNQRNHYESYTTKLRNRTCYCCGAYCTCSFFYRPRLLLPNDVQNKIEESFAGRAKNFDHSNKDSSNKDSAKKTDSCERCAATGGLTGSGSKTSQSGSAKHKGSRHSGDILITPVNGQLVEGDAKFDVSQSTNNNGSKREIEFGGYKRFGRRFSPRFSGSSTGTFSYLDPSTKQTSLNPSSAFTPTPRGSFQRSTEQNSFSKLDIPTMPKFNSPTTGNFGYPHELDLSSALKYSWNKDNRININSRNSIHQPHSIFYENQEDPSDSGDNHVITIFCPQLQPEPRPMELLTVHEQSDSPSNQSTIQTEEPTREVIQISVHTAENNTETGLCFHNRQMFPLANSELTADKIPSIASDAATSGQFAKEIPFVDDESDDTPNELPNITPDQPCDSGKPPLITEIAKEVDVSNQVSPTHRPSAENLQELQKQTACLIKTTEAESSPNKANTIMKNKRRFSIYPGFTFQYQHRTGSGKTLSEIPRRMTLKESRRRGSVRHLREEVQKFAERQYAAAQVKKKLLPFPESNSNESSDVDDFAQISRLVAREALLERQARVRAHSLGATLDDLHRRHPIANASYANAL
ncbi:7 transmembrane receptor, partial [Opisthorchis viverrini]